MTERRHLKDLIRARMARTGESYTSARAQLARRARAKVVTGPFVVVPVTDMNRSTRFYREALELPVASTSETWTVVGRDGEKLALEPGGATGVELGIGIRVTDLDAAIHRVVGAGGRLVSRNGPTARVADPDGNLLRLMAVAATG